LIASTNVTFDRATTYVSPYVLVMEICCQRYSTINNSAQK